MTTDAQGLGFHSMKQESAVTVLVYAWDPYEPAWSAFCHGFHKYWPDCPYPLIFITNYLDPPCGTAVKVGDVNNFYQKMTLALERIESPFILFMHEDYWIKDFVRSENIGYYVSLLQQGIAEYIRLIPVPPPDRDFPLDSRLGIINTTSEYRVSFMASLWRVSTLKDLMDPTLTLWEHEKYGAKLSASYGERFLSVKKPSYGIDYVVTAISNRQWTRAAYEYVEKEGLLVDFGKLIPPPRYKVFVGNMHSFAYRIKRRVIKKLRRARATRISGWR